MRRCPVSPAVPPQVIEGISRVLGPRVWDNVVLGFTRASESSAPAGAHAQPGASHGAVALGLYQLGLGSCQGWHAGGCDAKGWHGPLAQKR